MCGCVVLPHAGEKYWRMPLTESLKAKLESPIADLKNYAGGTMAAAPLCLQHLLDPSARLFLPKAAADVCAVVQERWTRPVCAVCALNCGLRFRVWVRNPHSRAV
jgi:hypothetical protein